MRGLKRARRLAAGLLLAGAMTACASLPENMPRSESHALTPDGATRIGRALATRQPAAAGDNHFRPLPDGVDALMARIALAASAERTLDLQYYIWHDDLTGRFLTQALLRAADRGVRVRVLLDDVGTSGDDQVLSAIDAHPNIEIRLFNPVASRGVRGLGMLFDFERTNRRMHNKAFVADNQVAILGGRNIGDEYFGASPELAFGDLDVLTFGPVVPQVSHAFDRYWNTPASIPIAALSGTGTAEDLADVRVELDRFTLEHRDSPYADLAREALEAAVGAPGSQLFPGQAHLLYDDPGKITRAPEDTEGTLMPQFAGVGVESSKELLVVSPYFIPGNAGVGFFAELVKRGVRVTILTNSLAASDVGAVHSGYQRYRDALLDAGVQLYELRPTARVQTGKKKMLGSSRASLHAKTFVFDRRSVFIGSLNLDPRSLQLNTEIGIVCDSPPMADAIASGIEGELDALAWQVVQAPTPGGGTQLEWIERRPEGKLRLTEEPEVSTLRRLGVWFLGLLPIESQL
ncbi:phospholipase D family protein [Niveibacterium sp. 24ML]|uniref:phospholipase D family protein n=1 Tax=Niveibacterium sp. 24ML TaxID=2985512 RepID=UPI00226FECEA|nr:phospholipase D family protein [Niveibacterium sp. 24ML]MCX9155650.1 phospholipase D family protein [Niveibacterium sp. 24ML]